MHLDPCAHKLGDLKVPPNPASRQRLSLASEYVNNQTKSKELGKFFLSVALRNAKYKDNNSRYH